MMMLNNTPATKSDVEDAIKEITPGIVTTIVTKVVGSATQEILGAVGDQFEIVNDRLDGIENQLDIIETDASHARNISQATSDRTDRLEKRVKHLETKPA